MTKSTRRGMGLAVLRVQELGDVHVHEHRPFLEAGPDRELDAAAGKRDFAGLGTYPMAVGVAAEAVNELVHCCRLYGRAGARVGPGPSPSERRGRPYA